MSQLTELQKQIIEGALLGDGCLTINKHGKNACFSYVSKSYQHVEYVSLLLASFDATLGKITKYSYLDERTNKIYTHYKIRSRVHQELTELYYKWYNNKKKIPQDLVLSPQSLLLWYIGDGGLINSKNSQYIKLATQCFSKEEQETILIPQLINFEAKIMKGDIGSSGEQQYFLYIPHRKIQEFLSYIGPCPFLDYAYKWQYKEYVNKKPVSHTTLEKSFCQAYLGGKTYYQIAKDFSVEPAAVKYYLIKNNIYNPIPRILKNCVLQKQDNLYINIFKSGQEAANALGLSSSSSISQVCSGKRKTAAGYEWVKYDSLDAEEQEIIRNLFQTFFKENNI